MQSIPALAALLPRALLFQGEAYLEMKARPRVARDGVGLLLALGAALGLAGALGGILAWAALPEAAAVQRVLARGLGALPVLRRAGLSAPQAAALARADWLWWTLRWQRPAPPLALWRLVTVPLALVVEWLGFGVAAHRAACLLGGRGELRATLGCLALAEAPRALGLLPLFPPAGLAGLGVWAWVLAARFQAVRAAHGLDGWRAFWASALAVVCLATVGGLGLAAALILARAGLLRAAG